MPQSPPKPPGKTIVDRQTWYITANNVPIPNGPFLKKAIESLWALSDENFRTYANRKKSTNIILDYKLSAIAWIAFQFTKGLQGNLSEAKQIKLTDQTDNWADMFKFLEKHRKTMMPWTNKSNYKIWIGAILYSNWPSRYIDMNRKKGQGVYPTCEHYAYFSLLGVIGFQKRQKIGNKDEEEIENDDEDYEKDGEDNEEDDDEDDKHEEEEEEAEEDEEEEKDEEEEEDEEEEQDQDRDEEHEDEDEDEEQELEKEQEEEPSTNHGIQNMTRQSKKNRTAQMYVMGNHGKCIDGN